MKSEAPEPDNNSLALDRTVLANERTYQAWLRTGLAALVSGLGVAKFMQGVLPLWMLLALATLLLLFGAVAFLQAAWRYSHIHVRMAHLDIDAMPVWMAKVISMLLAGCSLFALGGLLVASLY
ncbi:hypothetical protein MNBD_GAMMA13-278 [hydrothermal vent metagenome]|uniref:DUF202 domain-containing protein n=1 Tax=hydrothermal vent metagenome TaxID=652676 RepID=A0A3B0ZBS9_9ZZZZ